MLKKNVFFLCLSIPTYIWGQSLVIKNMATQQPISDIYVYDESNTYFELSNNNGVIQLDSFPKDKKIFFSHLNYYLQQFSYDELKNRNFEVFLEEKIIALDELIYVSTKWQLTQNEVSQQIISIDKKDIEIGNPNTTADLLINTGQIFVQKSQLGGGSPSLRGFATNKVLLVVDGIRLNNGIYRSGNLQNVINIDPNIIENVEVIFGSGSVTYGSDALGGVMSFNTLSPKFSQNEKIKVEGGTFIRRGSVANEQIEHIHLSLGKKKISYLGSFSSTRLEDLKAGANRSKDYEGYFLRKYFVERHNGKDELVKNPNENLQVSSGYNLLNTIHKINFNITDKNQLSYGFYFSTTTDIPRYDRLTLPLNEKMNDDSLAYSEWYYGPQKWIMHSISWSNLNSNMFYDQMKFTTSWQNYSESRNDRRFNNLSLRTQKEEVEILTQSIDFNKIINTKIKLFYGVDGFYNWITSKAHKKNIETLEIKPTDTRYPNAGSMYYSFAMYSSLFYSISEKWNFNLGARWNNIGIIAKTNNNNSAFDSFRDINFLNQAVTGNLGTNFIPNKNTKISILLSSGFRSPNVDDIGKVFEITDNIISIPNNNLKPEYVYNQEISFQRKFGDETFFDIVFYHSYLTNAIIRNSFSVNGKDSITLEGKTYKTVAQVNTSKARIIGGSVIFKSQFTNFFEFQTSLSANEGINLINNEPLRHSTPIFGQTTLTFKKNYLKILFITDYNFDRNLSQISKSDEFVPSLYTKNGSPGWVIFNIKSQYQIQKLGLKIEAGVENILDQHYRTYSSGISAPGRNFYVSLKYDFNY